jgi:hypothetical protein
MARKSFGYAAVCVELSMQHMKLPFQLVGARFVKRKKNLLEQAGIFLVVVTAYLYLVYCLSSASHIHTNRMQLVFGVSKIVGKYLVYSCPGLPQYSARMFLPSNVLSISSLYS